MSPSSGSALLYCPGEVQGPLSLNAAAHKQQGLLFGSHESGAALWTAAGARDKGGGEGAGIISAPILPHGRARLFHAVALGAGSPVTLTPQSDLLCCPGKV